jgi:hypothetical protein
VLTLDDIYAQVGLIEPRFAGVFYDQDNVLTILATEPDALASSRNALQSVFSGRQDLGEGQARVRIAEYSFLQLYEWGQSLPGLFDIDEVVSVGIDEAANRLLVGIERPAIGETVLSTLSESDVPPEEKD